MAQRSRFVIQPFSQSHQMDSEYASKTWQTLRNAIHEIHRQNASGLSFEELYRNAYNMVLHKFGDKLYAGLVETITDHLRVVANEVATANDDAFLQELKDKWDKHKLSSIMIRDILMYMVRGARRPPRPAALAAARSPAPPHLPRALSAYHLCDTPALRLRRTARTWSRRRRRLCTSAGCRSSATRSVGTLGSRTACCTCSWTSFTARCVAPPPPRAAAPSAPPL